MSEWHLAHEELLAKEKQHTRASDALAAERRRQPIAVIDADYVFTAPDGSPQNLPELFDGHAQLVIYHHMLEPGQDWVCDGCAQFADNIGHLEHLNARDTRLILMARAPQSEIDLVRQRMGWTVPWYSADGNTFYDDLDLGRYQSLSVLVRVGDLVYRSYYTTGRGVDRLGIDNNLLDLTPYGRQEAWEESPEGWPQIPTYSWRRIRDEYGT